MCMTTALETLAREEVRQAIRRLYVKHDPIEIHHPMIKVVMTQLRVQIRPKKV